MTAATPARLRWRLWSVDPRPPIVLALLVAVLAASVVAVPRAIAQADESRFAAVFESGRGAEITLGSPWDRPTGPLPAALDAAVDDFAYLMRPSLQPLIGSTGWVAVGPSTGASGLPVPAGADSVAFSIGISSALAEHAEVVAGALPRAWTGQGALEVAIDESVAADLGVVPGTALSLSGVPVTVTGLVRIDETALSATARVFLRQVRRDQVADGPVTLDAVLLAARDSAAALTPLLVESDVSAWFGIREPPEGVAAGEQLTSDVRSSVAGGAYLTDGTPLVVSSRLPALLDRAADEQRAARSLVWLLAAGSLAALVVAVVTGASALVRARDATRRLLRARGARSLRLAVDGAIDAVVVGLPSSIAGAAIAAALLPGRGMGDAVTVALGLPIALGVLGAAGSLPASPPTRRAASLVATVVPLLLGAVAVVALVTRGSSADPGEVDPLLASSPATAGWALAVVVAVLAPRVLRAMARMLRPSPWRISPIAAAWSARRVTATAPILALVLAFASVVSGTLIAATIDDGRQAAARGEVGADVRIDPGADGVLPDLARVTRLPAVAAAVRVDVVADAEVTDDGRLRATQLLVADSAELSRVRPDLPVASRGELVVSETMRGALRGRVEVEGVGEVSIVVAEGSLPVDDDRWALLDSASVPADATTTGAWMLVHARDGDSAAAVAQLREELGSDARVRGVSEAVARRGGEPTAALVGVVLAIGPWLAVALAMGGLAAAVFATGREREGAWASLRLSGATRRGRLSLALWQFAPVIVLGAAAGVGLGAAANALILGAVDVPALVGSAGSAGAGVAPAALWSVVAAGGVTGAVVLAARAVRPRPLNDIVRNGGEE